ncbi:hypothetical protein [Saccharothrix deserti]
MRLLRVGQAGHERPAVLDPHGTAYDLTPLTADIDGLGRQRHVLGQA